MVLGRIKELLLGKKYRCDRCGDKFRGNRSSCPGCGHTVFTPADD